MFICRMLEMSQNSLNFLSPGLIIFDWLDQGYRGHLVGIQKSRTRHIFGSTFANSGLVFAHSLRSDQ
jgi:hypothetical protein